MRQDHPEAALSSDMYTTAMFGSLCEAVRADVARNRGNAKKMLLVLMLYRVAHFASTSWKRNKIALIWAGPYLLAYWFITEWVFNLEIPASTRIGKGLIVNHGYALVINKDVTIGDYCRVRHSTTIGCVLKADGTQGPAPRIGNHVDIGANAVIIGGVVVGDFARIGAGAVVVRDVPPHSTAIGNPARIFLKGEVSDIGEPL
jgi:colanic acid biosynthesis acetyltransferase WcaB